MIYLRLDERLMHGQVTTTWVGVLGITHIVLANDEVAKDEVHCQLLKMSAPQGIRLMIVPVERAVRILNDPRCEKMKLLAICLPNEEQRAEDELSVQSDSFHVLWVNTEHMKKAADVVLPSFFEPMDDTQQYMHCKIWNVNTSHCSLAYLGQYYGYENVCDAAKDDQISRMAYFASQEAYAGLSRRYHLPKEQDREFTEELWNWYRDTSMKDTVVRVGNDPLRKLRRNDRFIGAALNALNYGILPVHICQNAAYGFYFHNEGDPRSDGLQEMLKAKGIEQTIKEVCGLDPEHTEKDKIVYDLILAKYWDLAKENPVDNYLK